MNGKTVKKMRKHIDKIVPNMLDVAYKHTNEHQKAFTYPKGTHIPMDNARIHAVHTEGLPVVHALVDTTQVVLGNCKRKYYKQLKRDILASRRGVQAHV